ncbi:MAG: TonB-dependent siderophore receptor [Opitutaceae bacterium]
MIKTIDIAHIRNREARPSPRNRLCATIKTFVCPVLMTILAGFIDGLLVSAHAQAAAPTGEKRESPTGDAAPAPGAETPITLSPFEVTADPDDSYGAVNSNSITGFNTELARLPLSAEIFTETFMKDIGARTIEEMLLDYSAGAGFAMDSNNTIGNTQPGDSNFPRYMSLRGLSITGTRRDGFMSGIMVSPGMSSSFDIERVEVINGPQSLLYGSGGAGGVVNMVSKRAYFDRRPSGSISLGSDHYGNYESQLDYSQGGSWWAARAAINKSKLGSMREGVFSNVEAAYLQLAVKYRDTTIRIVGERAFTDRYFSLVNLTYTARNAADDARHNHRLSYLLATNQLERAAIGAASGGGFIGNGHITWENLNSYEGDMRFARSKVTYGTLMLETKLADWLWAEAAIGYNHLPSVYRATSSVTMLAPNHASNTTGQWMMHFPNSLNDYNNPNSYRTKAFRGSLIAKNRFFRGRVESQTIVGVDYSKLNRASDFSYPFLADADGNIIVDQARVANRDFGRTSLGRPAASRLRWSVQDGPVKHPFWEPFATHMTHPTTGLLYVRAPGNFENTFPVTPNNPLGVNPNGRAHTRSYLRSRGVFAANTLNLFDNRLDVLSGFRFSDLYRFEANQAQIALVDETNFSYSLGVNYHVNSWLSLYVNGSDSYNTPDTPSRDPHGAVPGTSHGIGTEFGFKAGGSDGRISGSVAFYAVKSEDEPFRIQGSLRDDINPSGLNGAHGEKGGNISVDRQTRGMQASITAAPARGWRMRLSAAVVDGKFNRTISYAQYYNDQFNANSAGQVTYENGQVVYVNPTFSESQPTVPSTTAGAIPLTIAMMNTPSSPYYAAPMPLSGRITPSSAVAAVLSSEDPVNGSILTGVTGLPISDIQITPGFPLPGEVPVAIEGEETVGYPKYSLSMTNMYSFNRGFLEGFRIGGTVSLKLDRRNHYYFPNGVQPGKSRAVFDYPDMTEVGLIAAYDWKIGRYSILAQLNVDNLFNNYNVLVLPAANTGFNNTNALIATFDNQPRRYRLTCTLKF